MAEEDAIARSGRPATVTSLVTDLTALGLHGGMTVIVHASLSALGYVSGGAQAVVMALRQVLGEDGTLVMPTHSGDLSDPATWSNPPIPASWWDVLRAEMPAYDPLLTPTRGMGAVVECSRHLPGVRRSAHPTVSAAAAGPHAAHIVSDHELAHGLGEGSPQARVYDLDGRILLLGVGHANNTSLHLAEHRSAGPDAVVRTEASPITVDGARRWVSYLELDGSTDDSPSIGEAFAASGGERSGPVGADVGRLMRSRHLVDFAVDCMRAHRG